MVEHAKGLHTLQVPKAGRHTGTILGHTKCLHTLEQNMFKYRGILATYIQRVYIQC